MYADFDKVSFSAMSNSQPSPKDEGFEPVQCRPTSESLSGSEISAQEEDNKSRGGMGERGGGPSLSIVAADKDALQEEVAESSGGGLGDPSKGGATGGGVGDRHRGGGVDDDGDDGYRTPTSPRHRIPADLPCPPAPRKLPPKRRCQKRKAGGRKIYRVVRRRIQLPGELELVLLPVVDAPPAGPAVENDGGGDAFC